MNVVAAVLAAGASRRLGRPKQLAIVAGEPLVRRTTRQVLASSCARVAVVVGARAPEVSQAVADLAVDVVANDAWPEGMGASIRAAAEWAVRSKADALVLCIVDQPLLGAAHLDALVDAFRGSESDGRARRIVASAYEGLLGVPAVFGASLFAMLSAVTGDAGARSILRAHDDVGAVPWPDGAVDVDTVEDLDALRR